jgi:hypothetical protein
MKKNNRCFINPSLFCFLLLSPFIYSCSFNASAIADDLDLGFTPSNPFPERDMRYDVMLKESEKVSSETLKTLMNNIKFPQSESALVSLLGYPYSQDGEFSYWEIEGGSEVAIYFSGGQGLWYTVGQY